MKMCHLQLLHTFRIIKKYQTNRSQSWFKNGRFYLNALYIEDYNVIIHCDVMFCGEEWFLWRDIMPSIARFQFIYLLGAM